MGLAEEYGDQVFGGAQHGLGPSGLLRKIHEILFLPFIRVRVSDKYPRVPVCHSCLSRVAPDTDLTGYPVSGRISG